MRRDFEGRFLGARVNCESVPLLPVWALLAVLEDPRRVPYLMVWKHPRSGKIQEVARVATYVDPRLPSLKHCAEVKRSSGQINVIHTIARQVPHGGVDRLLLCPKCGRLRRALYGWELNRTRTHSAFLAPWQCRVCARLRYTSEGGVLVLRSRFAFLRAIERRFGGLRSPRPEPYYPLVFSSPEDAAAAGLITLG